jgi:hypothetical protein
VKERINTLTSGKLSYKYLLMMVLSTCILACSNDNEQNVKEAIHFEVTEKITSSEILKDEIKIKDIHCAGEFVLGTLVNDDFQFKIFDRKSLIPLGYIVEKGRGPREIPTIGMFDHFEIEEDQTFIWIHDLNIGDLYEIHLEKSVEKNETIYTDTISLPDDLDVYRAFVMDHKKIVGHSHNSTINMKRLFVFDLEKNSLDREVKLFPPIEKRSNTADYIINLHNQLYVSSLSIDPQKTMIASAMAAFDRIDVWNNKGDLLYTINNFNEKVEDGIDHFLSTGNFQKDHLFRFYNDVVVSDQYIITLYHGKSIHAYLNEHYPTEIRIFDHTGDPIFKIQVVEKLASIDFDYKNRCLYGVDVQNEKILKYDLNDIL